MDSGGVATHLERSSYGSAEFLDRTGFDEMEPESGYGWKDTPEEPFEVRDRRKAPHPPVADTTSMRYWPPESMI